MASDTFPGMVMTANGDGSRPVFLARAGDPYAAAAMTLDGGGPLAFLNADQRTGIADNGKPSLTIDEAANKLVGGAPGWSRALGVGATVTYAYRADAPAVMPDDAGGFERFSTAQIDQAELALRAWADVANIRFASTFRDPQPQ